MQNNFLCIMHAYMFIFKDIYGTYSVLESLEFQKSCTLLVVERMNPGSNAV